MLVYGFILFNFIINGFYKKYIKEKKMKVNVITFNDSEKIIKKN